MGLREQLGLPAAAKFAYGEDGSVHIVSMFGDTWCTDEWDDDLDDYVTAPELIEQIDDPETTAEMCAVCRRVAETGDE